MKYAVLILMMGLWGNSAKAEDFTPMDTPLSGFQIMRTYAQVRDGSIYTPEQLAGGEAFRAAVTSGDFSSCGDASMTGSVISTSDEQAHKVALQKGDKDWHGDIPWGSASMTTHWGCYNGKLYLSSVSAETAGGPHSCEVPIAMGYCDFGSVLIWQKP